MTAKRFRFNGRTNCIEYDNKSILLDSYGEDIEDLLNALHEENEQLRHDATILIQSNQDYRKENEQLKQYKQAVSDVLRSWSQKNLTAKQLQVVIAIMEELNILGDVE